MNKNQLYRTILVLGLSYGPASFTANATELRAINSAMTNKLTTAAQMVEHFKKLAANGEIQSIELHLKTFIARFALEAQAGSLSQAQIDQLRTNAIAAVRSIKGKLSQGTILSNKLATLTYGITSTQSQPVVLPTPIPTPTPLPIPAVVTEQDRDNYLNALIKRLYTQSQLRTVETMTPDTSAAYTFAMATSSYFRVVLERATVAAPAPTLIVLTNQYNDYKKRLSDILRSLAMNDIATVNTQLNKLPFPLNAATAASLYGLFETTPAFTYQDYLTKSYKNTAYQMLAQTFARTEKLFENVTMNEITAAIQGTTPPMVSPTPTPTTPATPVTQSDRDNYAGTLIKKLYQQSNLKFAEVQTPSSLAAYTLAMTQGNYFKAALERTQGAPTGPAHLIAEYNDYKTRLTNVFRSLAAGDIPAVNVQLNQLPAPINDAAANTLYGVFSPTPVTQLQEPVSRKYNDTLLNLAQTFARNEKLFENVSMDEITAAVQSIQ